MAAGASVFRYRFGEGQLRSLLDSPYETSPLEATGRSRPTTG
jgi:hypothetical protein